MNANVPAINATVSLPMPQTFLGYPVAALVDGATLPGYLMGLDEPTDAAHVALEDGTSHWLPLKDVSLSLADVAAVFDATL